MAVPNRKQTEPLLPHSMEAEQAVLGSAMISKSGCEYVLKALVAEDFYYSPHRLVFNAIAKLHEAGTPPDILNLPEALKQQEQLDACGGMAYIHALTEAVPTAAHVEHYALIVAKKATMRKLIVAGRGMVQFAGEADTPDTAIEEARTLLEAAEGRWRSMVGTKKPISARELQIQKFPPILYVVPDMLPQGLVVLHSRPKTGKTRLADNLALSVAFGGTFLGRPVQKASVLCLYLEDTPQSAQERLNALLGDEVAPENLELHFEWKRWDQGGRADLVDYLAAHPECKLVIIDTMEMVRPPQSNTTPSIYGQDVAALAQFKKVADQFGICLLLIHHSKKGSDVDDLVDSASGTSGVVGSADTIIRLRKLPTGNAALEGRGRKVREFSLTIRMDETLGWQYVGETEEVSQSSEEREVMSILANEMLKPLEVAEELGLTRTAARQRLRRMAQKGLVAKNRNGCYYATGALPHPSAAPASPAFPAVPPQTAVTPVTPVTVVAGVPCHTVTLRDTETPVTPVTSVTNATGVTPVTPVTGVTPPDPPVPTGPLPELDLPDEADDWDLRRRTFQLAWARGWPRLELDPTNTIQATQEDWGHVCRGWFITWVASAYRRLEAMG